MNWQAITVVVFLLSTLFGGIFTWLRRLDRNDTATRETVKAQGVEMVKITDAVALLVKTVADQGKNQGTLTENLEKLSEVVGDLQHEMIEHHANSVAHRTGDFERWLGQLVDTFQKGFDQNTKDHEKILEKMGKIS